MFPGEGGEHLAVGREEDAGSSLLPLAEAAQQPSGGKLMEDDGGIRRFVAVNPNGQPIAVRGQGYAPRACRLGNRRTSAPLTASQSRMPSPPWDKSVLPSGVKAT